MDWKNTFEKAGSLSKLAFTALKNAQQKIDAVLDIELNSDITPPASLLAESKHLEEPRRTFDGPDVTHSSFVNNDAFSPDDDTRMQLDPVSPNTKDCEDRSASKFNSLLTETPLRIPTTPPVLGPDVISLSVTSIPTSFKGIPVSSSSPSIETVSTVTLESTHLDRSCSETDLTCLKTCTLGNIAHHKTPRTDAELDVETTTTGSDIEVMSCGNSTNGDSLHLSHQLSHQQSPLTHAKEVGDFSSSFGPHACTKYFSNSLAGRHALSPVSEMRFRGHRRAVSQEFRFGHLFPNEEDASFAFQCLSKSYAEKKHLLAIREAKILDLSKENTALRELNSLLESQLISGNSPQDFSSLSMEFSQRLSKTELQLRMVSRERDQLKASLANAQARSLPNKGRPSASASVENHLKRITELERLVTEKTTQHEDLFREGEKLAQQLLKANNQIKKLRANEKEVEQRAKDHAEKLETMNVQVQRLQSGLKAKDESIKEQANQVAHLRKLSQTQEKELEHLKVQLLHSSSKLKDSEDEVERLERKVATLEEKLDQAQLIAQSTTRATENEQALREECQILKMDLASLKTEFTSTRLNHERQTERWREEREYFQRLLAESTSRAESMGDAATTATQPAMLQLLELQATMQKQSAAWEQKELDFTQRLAEAQRQSQLAMNSDRAHSEQLRATESRVLELENSLSSLRANHTAVQQEYQQLKDSHGRCRKVEQELTAQLENLTKRNKSIESRLAQLQLSIQRQSEEEEYEPSVSKNRAPRSQSQCETQRRLIDHEVQTQVEPPTLSIDHDAGVAHSESKCDLRDPTTAHSVPQLMPLPQFANFASETVLEYLQSLLKLRDGECAQLRRDVERLTRTKESLLSEIASLSSRSEQLARLAGVPADKHSGLDAHPDEMADLQRRYDSLLLTYGRVIEENNELRLDLEDIKAMYRTQIDMLFRDS